MIDIVKTPATDKEPNTKAIEEMTPEQLELNRKRFMFRQGLLQDDPDKAEEAKSKEEAKPAETPKEEAKTDEGKADEAKLPKPAKRKLPVAPAAPALTPEIISTAVETGARAAIESTRPKPTEAAPQPDLQLEAEDTDTIEALRLLEATQAIPAGTADKTMAFWKKENDYIEKWQVENPEGEFNPEAAEHKSWYARNEPAVSQKALEKAKDDLRTQRIVKVAKEEAKKEMAPALAKIDQVKYERELEKRLPEIDDTANQAVVDLVEKTSPELAKLLEKDGKKVLSEETQTKIEEADPLVYSIITEASEGLRVLSTELDLLTSFPRQYQFDPGKVETLPSGQVIFPHRRLVEFITDLEGQIVQLPEAERVLDGKTFMPQPEMIQREQKIRESKTMNDGQKKAAVRDLYGRHWRLSTDDIRAALVADTAEKTAGKIDKFVKLSEKRHGKKNGEGSNGTAQPASGEVTPSTVKPLRKTPPSVSQASDKVDIETGGKKDTRTQGQIIDEKVWGIT